MKQPGFKITLLQFFAHIGFAGFLFIGASANRSLAVDAGFRRAFPDPIPADTDFDTVVNSQPNYAKIKYPEPIIGWKHHPEEIHITPEGALVLPEPRHYPLYVAPLIALQGEDPHILDPDHVRTSLVDGYKPGIQSEWQVGGLSVHQLAFATLMEGDEVLTGKETLLGLVRYNFKNESAAPVGGVFSLNFGLGALGQSHKEIPPLYPAALRFSDNQLFEANGAVAARVLANSLGELRFIPASTTNNLKPRAFAVFNESESTISNPEYVIELDRSGDDIRASSWESPHGFDFYYKASTKHSSSGAVQMEVIDANNQRTKIGLLGAKGLTQDSNSSDVVAPGRHTEAVTWAQLKSAIPQGKSKLSLRPLYESSTGLAPASSWEPVFYLAKSGTKPAFGKSGNPEDNALQITFALQPGETKILEFVLPYFPLPAEKATDLRHVSLEKKYAVFRNYWEKELNRNTQFIIPEERLRNAYRTWLANNLMLVDRDPKTGFLLIHPDATEYEHVWAGDSSVVMQTMDRMGYHQEVQDYAKYFIARQGTRKPDADVTSWNGFFPGDVGLRWLSENGFILWALCQHYKLTGDTNWLKANAQRLVDSADWVIRETTATKVMENGTKPRNWGLLPKGRPSDLGDWDNWYFNDTYSYMGIRNASEVLADAGRPEDAKRIAAAAADYKSCIIDSINRSINHDVNPPFVPLTPYKNDKPTMDYLLRYWYNLNPPIYMVEAGLFDANDDKATWSNYWVEKDGMISGLPIVFTEDTVDPHYAYHQALSYLLRGQTDRFVWTMYSMYAYGQSRETYATIECTSLITGEQHGADIWNDERQPHMHSNSRCLAMLRISLLLEVGNELHLMKGTPRGWLDDGKKVEVRKAPTDFGEVNYNAESKIRSGEVIVSIDPPTHKTAAIVLHVRPPSKYGDIRSVTVDGKAWTDFSGDAVKLGELKGRTRVVCKFK